MINIDIVRAGVFNKGSDKRFKYYKYTHAIIGDIVKLVIVHYWSISPRVDVNFMQNIMYMFNMIGIKINSLLRHWVVNLNVLRYL